MKRPQINFSGHPQYIRVMKTTEKSGYSKFKSEYLNKIEDLTISY